MSIATQTWHLPTELFNRWVDSTNPSKNLQEVMEHKAMVLAAEVVEGYYRELFITGHIASRVVMWAEGVPGGFEEMPYLDMAVSTLDEAFVKGWSWLLREFD